MQIFISGCAKTRTTLVQWLFSAFESCVILPGEFHLNVFRLNHLKCDETYHLVAKRIIDSILSHPLTEEAFKDQICRVRVDNIKLVRVTRNREDTLKSDNGYVSPERYDECERQAEFFKDLIAVEIDSDVLLENPDEVQAEVAGALGLTIKHKWSEWPDFAPRDQMAYISYPKMFNPLKGK